MTETTHSDDPLDQVIFELNEEQTSELSAVLADPPMANEAMRELMARTPPWKTMKM